MKQFLSALFCIICFVLMLLLPKATLSGATNGLLLWFQIILPTLLPFFIITNILIQTNAIRFLSHYTAPLLRHLFCVSDTGSFVVVAGFLCGYPIGAKVTADLVRSKDISEAEGNYLLSFCNNTSPAFIIGYLVLQNIKKESVLLPTLLILFVSPILCSFLFRRFYHISACTENLRSGRERLQFSFDIVDFSILNAFENITKIGGYIILFSIFIAWGQTLPFTAILSLLEITNGIPLLLKSFPDFSISYILTLSLCSFGGLCSIAQTKAMLTGTKLSITNYTIEKLITALVTSLFAFLFIHQ